MTFTFGMLTQCVMLQIFDDILHEGDKECFAVQVTPLTPQLSISTPQALVSIYEDDDCTIDIID